MEPHFQPEEGGELEVHAGGAYRQQNQGVGVQNGQAPIVRMIWRSGELDRGREKEAEEEEFLLRAQGCGHRAERSTEDGHVGQHWFLLLQSHVE